MTRWRRLHAEWPSLTFYQRFESAIALALTLIITLVIVAALHRLIAEVIGGVVLGVLDALEHRVFQSIFGGSPTVLIALEFNHTLQYVVAREQSIIQTKIVLPIALLALALKFIVLDLSTTTAMELLALAAITLALGITNWLMRERDDRFPREPGGRAPGRAPTDTMPWHARRPLPFSRRQRGSASDAVDAGAIRA